MVWLTVKTDKFVYAFPLIGAISEKDAAHIVISRPCRLTDDFGRDYCLAPSSIVTDRSFKLSSRCQGCPDTLRWLLRLSNDTIFDILFITTSLLLQGIISAKQQDILIAPAMTNTYTVLLTHQPPYVFLTHGPPLPSLLCRWTLLGKWWTCLSAWERTYSRRVRR